MARFDKLLKPTQFAHEPPYAHICVNEQYLDVLLNAIHRLRWKASWLNVSKGQAEEITLDLEAQILKSAADGCQEECADCLQEDFCLEYAPSYMGIDWSPSDPFNLEPDPPAGYARYPFYFGGSQPETVATDVLCDIVSTYPVSIGNPGIPIGIIDQITQSGVPRFRIRLNGTGKVRIHLLKMYLGGLASIRVDDDWTTAKNVDLRQGSPFDGSFLTTLLLQAITGFNLGAGIGTVVVELEITEPGEHFVDVAFIPLVEESNLLASGWGGGLRKVELCGFSLSSQIITDLEQRDCDILVTYGDGHVEIIALTELIERCKDCGCENCEDCGDSDCDDCSDCAEDCDECEECE